MNKYKVKLQLQGLSWPRKQQKHRVSDSIWLIYGESCQSDTCLQNGWKTLIIREQLVPGLTMIPCSLGDTYGLMNIHWQHSQRGSLFLWCIHIDLFTCPSPCADAPERTTNPLLSLVPTSTSLKLWRFDCLETRSACQKALCRPRKSTLSPHSQLVRFDMPVSQNTAPANKKSSTRAGEAQENARRHRQSAAPAKKY